MPLGMEVGLGAGDFVLDGDPAPLHKKGVEPPQFSAHVYCGQTAGWIKMALGMQVGLSPGDFVLGSQLPIKGAQPQFFPVFVPCLLWRGSATGIALDLRSVGRGFKLFLLEATLRWASCSHLCATVTNQYNLVPAKGW